MAPAPRRRRRGALAVVLAGAVVLVGSGRPSRPPAAALAAGVPRPRCTPGPAASRPRAGARRGAAPAEAAEAADATAPPPLPKTKLQRLASLGAAGTLAYGLVKFLKHITLTSLAWYFVGVHTGSSPLQRWPQFLSAYASLYVASVPLSPVKYAGIAAMTPAVDRVIGRLKQRLRISHGRATGLLLLALVSAGSALWAAAIALASLLAGVTVW